MISSYAFHNMFVIFYPIFIGSIKWAKRVKLAGLAESFVPTPKLSQSLLFSLVKYYRQNALNIYMHY